MLDRFLAAPDLATDWLVPLDDLVHALLDAFEILKRKRLRTVKIVVEPVLDRRADRDLGFRIEFQHGLGHDMSRVVADDLERGLVPPREQGDGGIGFDGLVQVEFATVHDRDQRGTSKPGTDVRSDLRSGHRSVILPDASIRQGDVWHGLVVSGTKIAGA